MNTTKRPMSLIFFVIFLAIVLSGCKDAVRFNSGETFIFMTYREIPGVSAEEIAAIEALKNEGLPLIYGMLISTETFENEYGEIRGYTALFCEWLSSLFGIPVIPQHYTWFELLSGLENGEIAFTGELTSNEERLKTYFMTGTMAQRSLKYFRITGSPSFAEIEHTRLPRYILQEKTSIAADVMHYAGNTFEPVYIQEYNEVYELLKNGTADALITESVQEAFWDMYDDITASDFFPMIYSPVSFSTQNPKYSPFISVMQKALDNNISGFLAELYAQGYNEYLKHKLLMRLTPEELAYIKTNPVIPFGAEYDNYPISFYNMRQEEWQGICIDVLNEISSLSGLKFSITHNIDVEFHDLLTMLESGELHILSEVIRSADREGRFIWPENSFMSERSVLISKISHPNINANRVYSRKIGLSASTAHTEFFLRWFPNHPAVIMYDGQNSAFNALLNDEIDMVMSNHSTLLYYTNYQENPDLKANILFDNSFESTYGINRNQKILCSIVDKALDLIDTQTISEQWRLRGYDYRLRLEQARTPWLIGLVILSMIVLILVAILFVRSRLSGRQLEKLVEKRTRELALQQTTMTTLFNSIPDFIFTKDLKFNFMRCNKAFLENFGINEADVIGKSDIGALGFSDDLAKGYNEGDRRVIEEGKMLVIEEIIPGKDGTNPVYETIKMPIKLDNSVVGILGIARNITKRKEMEDSLIAASRSKSIFLANMSHEIRTPMNAILGVTEILIQHETLPPEIREGLERIHSSCNLLLGIINDILDFSKIEAGKLDIMPALYITASMINDSVHLNMMRINSKPIEFNLQINENIPAKLIGDELRIKQILNNLLSNAFKYTDSGTVTLSIDYESNADSGITLVLSVSDSGHGMTRDQLEKMFEEYSRFHQKNKTNVEGTGLGLAITQRLINLMNGKIHVESEQGKGSLFVVKIPQELVDNEVLGKDVAANLKQFRKNFIANNKVRQVARDFMPYGNVLIVDDVETNLYVAEGLMKLYRLQVDTAMNGLEAIDKTLVKINEGKTYDIIFMDHMMPEMDGITAVKNIRDLGYTAPIIALTANAVAGQADMFLQNGFDGFISKPIDIRQLNSILVKFIRNKQPPEVIKAANQQRAAASNNDSSADTLLYESFIRDARKTIGLLEKYFQAGKPNDSVINDMEKLRQYTIFVHGIKSSLWNIGEPDMADSAFRLETASRELSSNQQDEVSRARNIGLIKVSTPGFIGDLHALLEKIEAKQAELNHNPGGSGNNDDNDIEDLPEKILEIQNMCGDYNRKGIFDIIAGINKYSKETKAVLDRIMEYVLHSEFEEAENAAASYAAVLKDLS